MKKIIATLALAVMTIAASAQIKSVDVKGDLRGDFGLGAGVTVGVLDKIDFAPSFNWYFTEKNTHMWTIDADFHYNFELGSGFTVYPLVGATVCNWGVKGLDSETKVGVNLGGGVKYQLLDNLGIFTECKYQWVDGADDTFFAVGVNINL